MHIALKRRTSCILYDFVVLQYRVTEVHFIVMYEFLYHIKWNEELLFCGENSIAANKNGP